MTSFADWMRRAPDLITKRRLKSAEAALQRAVALAPDNCAKSLAEYQSGALYWGDIGDGEQARKCFLSVVELWEGNRIPCSQLLPIPLLANACENLMILSLSFDEYFRWADKLERVAPKEEILHQQKPMVMTMQEQGKSWAEVMLNLSWPYVDPDPAKDAGRYGSAACILQLLLKNRKLLRLPQDRWRMVVIRYASIVTLGAVDCDKTMRKLLGRSNPAEFRLIIELSIPPVEEYTKANPGDEEVKKVLTSLQSALRIGGDAQKTSPRDKLPRVGDTRPVAIVLLIVSTALLFASSRLSSPWSIVVGVAGALIGLLAVSELVAKSILKSSSGALKWGTSSALAVAIRQSDLAKSEFQLVHVGPSVDGGIELRFQSTSPLDESKIRAAHLALRCVVGLTFPAVVSSLPGHNILGEPKLGYSVALADGVPIPAYFVQTSVERVGPLQVTSEEAEDGLWVYIAPAVIVANRPNGGGVLADIANGFTPLMKQRVVLGA